MSGQGLPSLQAWLPQNQQEQQPSRLQASPAPSNRTKILMLGDEIINQRQIADPAFKSAEYVDNGGGEDGGAWKVRDLLRQVGSEASTRMLVQRRPSAIVLHVGTHDQKKDGPLGRMALRDYEHILEILHGAMSTTALVVTGLLPRQDLGGVVVSQSNSALQRMVRGYNRKCKKEIAHFLPPPLTLCNRHFSDNVHLNAEGYKVWNESVVQKIRELKHGIGSSGGSRP